MLHVSDLYTFLIVLGVVLVLVALLVIGFFIRYISQLAHFPDVNVVRQES